MDKVLDVRGVDGRAACIREIRAMAGRAMLDGPHDYRTEELEGPLLFLTHTPHAYQTGDLHDGNVITRLVRVAPTALSNGGSAPCWAVYGMPNAEVSGEPKRSVGESA